MSKLALIALVFLAAPPMQDAATILKKGDALLDEAKTGYESARSKSSVPAFVEASFKLEEARIKYLVLQEIGTPELQKTAADRLRNVNQLGKLLHDGKVAISGTPAESKPAPDPATPASADPKPAAPDVKPPVAPPAVTARAAVPDAAQQRDVEKLIRDLFKDQYAKKAPADRLALVRSLLDQAAKATSPVEQYVLLREGLDQATQAADVATSMEAIDATAQAFDVDALAMKTAALTTLSKVAKSLEECSTVTVAIDRLIDELMAIDDYATADKMATTATITARRANDNGLLQKATARAKDVGDAKVKFQSMKAFLETLARNPEDGPANLEMGQFLCFYKGNWDLGLRFLGKGSDPVLKGLAEKEIALPIEAAAQADIADGWWDLAQKEKGATRKDRMVERARYWYQAASAQATGLLKIKLDRRMAEVGAEARVGVDLLKLVDPKQDAVRGGTWRSSSTKLVSPAEGPRGDLSILRVPYIPPAEYDLVLTVTKPEEKRGHDGSFDVGCPFPGGAVAVVFDATEGGLFLNGLDGPDSHKPIKLFPAGKTRNVVIALRKTSVTVTVDGTVVIQWKGDVTRCKMFYAPDQECMYLASWISYSITKFELLPVAESGRRRR
jgi:hypothetical protein